MPLEHFDPGAPLDEVNAGRQSLRLVKIRLALTLIAVAILPLAALAPIVRTVIDDPRVAQRERLTAQSDHMATETRRELEAVRAALLDAAAEPSIALVLGPGSSGDTVKAATTRLATIVDRPSDIVAGVAVIDGAGVPVLQTDGDGTVFSELPGPRPGASPFRYLPPDEGGVGRLEIAVPVLGPKGSASIGSVVAAIPLTSIVRWLNTDFTTSAERLSLLDGTGVELTGIVTTGDRTTGGQPSIEFTADATTRSLGTSDLGIPGIPGWRLVASAPMTVAVLPIPMLAVLGLLLCLLGIFIKFMTHQILAPATALEEQRARFHGLYLSARQAALQDNLTGLGNHRAFQEAVGRLVEQTRRHGHRFALVLLDIDEFKQVNDTRGHAEGDDLLIEVGNLIRSTIRGV